VSRCERRERQRLETSAEVQEPFDQRPHLRGAAAGEQPDVGTGAEHLTRSAHQESTDIVGGLQVVDDLFEIVDDLLADLVQGRVVQGQQRQGAVPLQLRGAHQVTSFCAMASDNRDAKRFTAPRGRR